VLQDLGDRLRAEYGGYAVASLAVREIIAKRGEYAPGLSKRAFIVESIKHDEEVDLLRRVYGESLRLLGVHSERSTRELRLVGAEVSDAKYRGADRDEVIKFIDRDENDAKKRHGQHVRNAFYLADYFLDNNKYSQNSENLTADLKRFVDLVLGAGLVRPTIHERAIYHAHAAALQSSCLSRQVGAVLVSADDEVVATGTNDAPMYGGGVYSEGVRPDNRCHAWVWDPDGEKFKGCHNDRKKEALRSEIGAWLASNLSEELALVAHPVLGGSLDMAAKARRESSVRIKEYLSGANSNLKGMPGIKDIIEYSRAIHAEMDAILSAARSGVSTKSSTLYCTTYPCHNCARHLVSAGVSRVYYIEPYVKSLATELHSDSISNELPTKGSTTVPPKMVVLPFTGVGPRMYEDFFSKKVALKGDRGVYLRPSSDVPSAAVRLRELGDVEKAAAGLVI
jgi:deoxycytidylate deaminase